MKYKPYILLVCKIALIVLIMTGCKAKKQVIDIQASGTHMVQTLTTAQLNELTEKLTEQGRHENLLVTISTTIYDTEKTDPATGTPPVKEHTVVQISRETTEATTESSTTVVEATLDETANEITTQDVRVKAMDKATPKTINWWLLLILFAAAGVVTYMMMKKRFKMA